MLEARTFVSEIESTRNVLEEAGATLKGEFRCRDLIFIPKNSDKPFGEEFLRLRVNEVNIWDEKDVVVVIKHVQRRELGKESLIPLREEFDTEGEARDYIEEHLSTDFTFDFEFTRTGWQYDLGEDQIDLEKFDEIPNHYTVEIKSKTGEGLKELARMLTLDSFVKGAILGEVKRLLSQS